jgi:Virulence-associated protein E-like domain
MSTDEEGCAQAGAARAQKDDHAFGKAESRKGYNGLPPQGPAQLIARPNWVVWKFVQKDPNKKPTKVPYQARSPKQKAASDDPSTWSNYAEAVAAKSAHGFDGVGFVLKDTEFAAFDLDDCRNPDTGAVEPWAASLIDRVASYTEVTPSGTGFRIIGTGTGDEVHRKLRVPNANGMTCELYRRTNRYIAVTGNVYRDTVLANIDQAIDDVLAELDKKKKPSEERPGGSTDLPPALATMLCAPGSGGYPTRSELLFAFLTAAIKAGVSRDAIMVAVLDAAGGISEHVSDNGGYAYLKRQLDKAEAATNLPWREKHKNGKPKPSFENARLAVGAIGVECRYDLFHHKVIIGFAGDDVKHEIKQFVGEFTDNAIMALRQLISKKFGFDPESNHVHDAIKSLALDRCFDPVLDMLAKAQGDWDQQPRLDGWVITYLGCEDTPLNRAIGRKVLIAAVRRARQPGCKFDAITVLEGTEGKNKSTAIWVLAGDENFSDQSILGARDKEVMEQLTGVWMHENADLAGMKKADVEHVKAFASRQVDRCRRHGAGLWSGGRAGPSSGDRRTTQSICCLRAATGDSGRWRPATSTSKV